MFEHTLIASRRQKTPHQRLLALPISAVLHLAVFTGLVLGQLITTTPVPEPTLWVGFRQTPLPPAPEPGGGGGKRAPARQKASPETTHAQPPFQQPVEVPSEPARPAEPEASGPESGMEGIDTRETGIGTGNGRGGPGAGSESGEPQPIEELPIQLTPDMTPPVLVQRVDPVYPEIAIKSKTQGVVILEAIIDRSGQVVDARIVRDLSMGCGSAALQAVRQWRYRPAAFNGRPIAVYLTVTVRFELH